MTSSWLLIPLMVFAAEPGAGETDAALRAELAEITARAKGVEDLTVGFEQERFTPLLKKPLVSSGTVRVKGERMLWETDKPFASAALIDGESLRLYYPKQKTLEVYPVDRKLGELAASPVPRLEALLENFLIERAAEQKEGRLSLRLTPLDEGLREHVREVRVEVDPSNGLAMRVEWSDGSGERTVVTFGEPQINTGLGGGELELKVPRGTKVVYPLGGGGEEEGEGGGEK